MPLSECSGYYNAHDYHVGSHLYNNVNSADKTEFICEKFNLDFMNGPQWACTIPQNSEKPNTVYLKDPFI